VATVADLIGALSCADVVVASRFHAVLLAMLLRRPVVALSYERKVKQLMLDAGLGEFCLDLEGAGAGRLMDLVAEAGSQRRAIAGRLDAHVRREARAVLAQFDHLAALLSRSREAGRPNAPRRT
jgi:polysaccharide pyruvyl transferase WcaK-like protein